MDVLYPNGQILAIQIIESGPTVAKDTLYPNGQIMGVRLFGDAPGAIPVGGIIMWSGLIADVPTDWAFCNGTDNAPGPDLRDKFVVGATQDSGGVAKTNIEGVLNQTGGVVSHSHTAHANLTHAGMTIGDHTGLTHSVAIANHPDLTHAVLSHAASTFTHNDHSVPSQSHTHAAVTLTHVSPTIPSQVISNVGLTHADISVASVSVSNVGLTHPNITVGSVSVSNVGLSHNLAGFSGIASSVSNAGIARTYATLSATSIPLNSHPTHSGVADSQTTSIASHPTHSGIAASQTTSIASHPTHTGSSPSFTVAISDHSVASFTGSQSATTLTHVDHSFPSLSHQPIGTHFGTAYGVHTITQPNDHGVAGTLSHSFSEPNDHVISAHNMALSIPNYYALAFIQRMI